MIRQLYRRFHTNYRRQEYYPTASNFFAVSISSGLSTALRRMPLTSSAFERARRFWKRIHANFAPEMCRWHWKKCWKKLLPARIPHTFEQQMARRVSLRWWLRAGEGRGRDGTLPSWCLWFRRLPFIERTEPFRQARMKNSFLHISYSDTGESGERASEVKRRLLFCRNPPITFFTMDNSRKSNKHFIFYHFNSTINPVDEEVETH